MKDSWSTKSHRQVPVILPHAVADELDMAVFRVGTTRADALLTAVKDFIAKVNKGEIS